MSAEERLRSAHSLRGCDAAARTEGNLCPYHASGHRMGQAGRNHSGSSGPSSLLKQNNQSTGNGTVSRQFWNISSEGGSTASLGNLFRAQSLPRTEVLPHVQVELAGHQFLPVPLVPLLGPTEQSPGPALSPPCRQAQTGMRAPLSCVSSRG